MTIAIPVGEMIGLVKNIIRRYLSTRAPGLLEILNLYSLNIHGKEIPTLLIESPCTVYRLLYQLYKDRTVATAIMANLFIAPLSTIENPSIYQFFLNKLKECIDKELEINGIAELYRQIHHKLASRDYL